MKLSPLLAASVIALGGFAASNASALDCQNARTQADMNACSAHALELQTQIINANYNAYRARLSPVQKEAFKQVQLAWIKYKDTSCTYEASGVASGSVYPMILSQCLAEKTRVRNLEIVALMHCREGDLSCPN